MPRRVTLATFAWLAISATALSASPAWQPAKTWVFAVGVLQFDDAKLQTYPEKGRVDAVMIDVLKRRGVPDDQIVFIRNEQATKDHLQRELIDLLKQTSPDDTLLFYYTGHGGRNYSSPKREINFITYDTKSHWMVSEMLDAIESHFQGSLAILTADCCHSGGLAEEAARRSKKISYAVLTSSQPASVSTSNWTFTQCLADLFRGQATMDLDRNGEICFSEAAAFCDAEMCFCENQRAGSAAIGKQIDQLVLAKADGNLPSRVGEYCEAKSHGIWMKAKIKDAKEGKFLVTWVGRPAKAEAWMNSDELRRPEPGGLEAGQHVRVEWNGAWYQGTVLQTHNGLHLVHYEGFPEADDEWIPLRRLRPRP